MGWSIDRSLKARNAAVSRMRDEMSASEIYSASHAVQLDRTSAVMASLKGAPHWVAAYVSGYKDALQAEHYARYLVYAHVAPDGTLYTGHKSFSEHFKSSDTIYKEGRGAEMSTWPNGHFWARTGKIYFCSHEHAEEIATRRSK